MEIGCILIKQKNTYLYYACQWTVYGLNGPIGMSVQSRVEAPCKTGHANVLGLFMVGPTVRDRKTRLKNVTLNRVQVRLYWL